MEHGVDARRLPRGRTSGTQPTTSRQEGAEVAKTFDRGAWVADREAKLSAAKDALERGLRALVTGEDWKESLRALAVLGSLSILRLSFTNAVLVKMQRPGTRI